MPISRPYVTICRQLYHAGGAATLDPFGRIILDPAMNILSSTPAQWLWLVAHGLVASNKNNQLVLTPSGESLVRAYEAKLTADVVVLADVRTARRLAS